MSAEPEARGDWSMRFKQRHYFYNTTGQEKAASYSGDLDH